MRFAPPRIFCRVPRLRIMMQKWLSRPKKTHADKREAFPGHANYAGRLALVALDMCRNSPAAVTGEHESDEHFLKCKGSRDHLAAG